LAEEVYHLWARRFRHRLPVEEFIRRGKERDERIAAITSAEQSLHRKMLDEGMRGWIERARQAWLDNGGYGLATPEQAAEIRAAGYEVAPPAPSLFRPESPRD
jgi:hypothetical protein